MADGTLSPEEVSVPGVRQKIELAQQALYWILTDPEVDFGDPERKKMAGSMLHRIGPTWELWTMLCACRRGAIELDPSGPSPLTADDICDHFFNGVSLSRSDPWRLVSADPENQTVTLAFNGYADMVVVAAIWPDGAVMADNIDPINCLGNQVNFYNDDGTWERAPAEGLNRG